MIRQKFMLHQQATEAPEAGEPASPPPAAPEPEVEAPAAVEPEVEAPAPENPLLEPEVKAEPEISLTGGAKLKTDEQVKEDLFQDFLQTLPEEFRDDPSLQVHKSFETMAKSYVHAQKQVGADKVVVPGKNATQEDWTNVMTKLGLPKEAAEYKVDLGENNLISEEFLNVFTPKAHELGILPRQAESLLKWYSEASEDATIKQQENFAAEQGKEMESLRKEWGPQFVDKVNLAKQAFEHVADDDLMDYFNNSGLTSDPKIIKLFAQVADSMGEDTFKGEQPVDLGISTEDAQAELNGLMGDHDGPYYKKNHPGHVEAVARVGKLMKALN